MRLEPFQDLKDKNDDLITKYEKALKDKNEADVQLVSMI